MTAQLSDTSGPWQAPRFFEALAYEAPFVVEKLLKERIVETPEEGERLFTEVKRFLVLAKSDRTLPWEMYSARVDEAWHQFILFTPEYMDFCNQFFGMYLPHSPHSPHNASASNGKAATGKMSFRDFKERYEALYGEVLPDAWYDHRGVAVSRRVFNDRAGEWTVLDIDEMSVLSDGSGQTILAVSALARQALEFITRTGVFYVRELPGDLTDEEKTALVAALVEGKALRAGS
jgi:hypothetical protein